MKYFQVKSEAGISYIQISRADRLNALNTEAIQEFKQVLTEIETNEDQIVILSGDGRGFCAGGDISMMQEVTERSAFSTVMDDIEEIVTKFYLMPKMIISAVHGPCVGLGLSIALSTDYIIANQDANISMNFIGIGLIPDGGGHFWLKERLGTQRAKLFAWEGKSLSGADALEEGLVDQVSTGDVLDDAIRLAEKWQERAIQAMIATKQVYHRNEVNDLLHLLKEERIWQWDVRQTDDHIEAVNAFLEKRKPKFTGK